MKQSMWSALSLWPLLWAIFPTVGAMKLMQESNSTILEAVNVSLATNATEIQEGVQSALIARSRSFAHEGDMSRDQSLDAVVSAKIFHDIADGVVSAADTLASAGLTVGTAAANAAMVVGKHVIKAADLKLPMLDWSIRQAADQIGSTAVGVGYDLASAGEFVADASADLAGAALEQAKQAAKAGEKVAGEMGRAIAEKAAALGSDIEKLGPLAAGLAAEAWSHIKDFVLCVAQKTNLLCRLLIGNTCDCSAGSRVEVDSSSLTVKCVFRKGGELSLGYGTEAKSGELFGKKKKDGRLTVPGRTFRQPNKPKGQHLKQQRALKSQTSRAPSGSCETSLDMGLDATVQSELALETVVNTNGNTQATISGLIRASITGLVKAQGSCALTAEKRFPKLPKKKVVCVKAFCIMFMLQFVAELEMNGILTGTVEVGAYVDFDIAGTVTVDKSGNANVNFKSPSIHHQDGFAIGASAFASIRVGAGPLITVFPMPGVPINFNPMFHAEVRAQGTLRFGSGISLLEGNKTLVEDSHQVVVASNQSSTQATTLEMCGAAAVNIYADTDITAFALPLAFRVMFSTDWIMKAITEAIVEGKLALLDMMTAGVLSCVPGSAVAKNFVTEVASKATSAVTSMIPNLSLDFGFDVSQLMLQKMYCVEVYKTPGFDSAPCAAELGCKHAGRLPSGSSESGVDIVPVQETVQKTAAAPACHDLPMGDHFIQLGNWRLAAMDANHFSLSHVDGKTIQIWRNDGHLFPGPHTTWGSWHRPIGEPKGISFGFQFIQIGNFRLGAADDEHLSISHVLGKTIEIFKFDGYLDSNRHDYGTYDRREGPPAAISFGDRFLQLGKFRLGDADGVHFIITHPTHRIGIQVYSPAGLWPHTGTHFTPLIEHRKPADWTCKDIGEMVFGPCKPHAARWGDRFIQLGDWRLAAIDENHFSISHRSGKTAQIFRSDGTLHPGPRWDWGSWDRPIGFPGGIAFGDRFIQLGNWRVAAVHDHVLSISAKGGKTAQVFGHLATGWLKYAWTSKAGPMDDFSAWALPTGTPAGVTFGDRFLQLGNFRIGADGVYNHLILTHGAHTLQYYTSAGSVRTENWYGSHISHRYPQWHCGDIQTVIGACPGIIAGQDFLQLGDWRLGAMDNNHFSIAHISGGVSQIYYAPEGKALAGWKTSTWGAWGRETKKTNLIIGDRFIQFGQFRVGEVDATHFSVSHSNGYTMQIFRSDGTLHPGPRRDFGLWGRDASTPSGVTFGDRFVQIGHFRIGDIDSSHLSVAHVDGQTVQIFHKDSWTNHGPGRTDWTTFGRSLSQCRIM